MGDLVKQILAIPIQLSDQVIKAAEEAASFKQECSELKSKAEKLSGLLRQAARASNDLYERPTRRIIDDTEQVLEKALALVAKCTGNGLIKRVFTIIPAAAFRKMSAQLENSIGDVSWLLRVSAPAADRDDEYLGLPPIAANEPILGLIWEQIAILHNGSVDDRSEAAASLVSLARDNDRNGKLIIEEGGVGPLLKLLKDGKPEAQENAARAIGQLGKDHENIEHLLQSGVCNVFVKTLKEGPMSAQAVVAWATSEMVANYPKCQDNFAQHNIVRSLVSHLAFETVEEHSKYAVASKATSMHSIVTSTMAMKDTAGKVNFAHYGPQNPPPSSHKGREAENPSTKAYMKEMAARALWQLSKGNSAISRSITESRALLCFAVLLDKGPAKVQLNSAMALMEITAVAEEDSDLRRAAFKPNSPACKAVVDQLFIVIERADSELLVPCIKAVGHLARTFRATETRMITPLVRLLDDREVSISREACIALAKFACSENYLHLDHSKAIISAGGAKHLVQLVYFEPTVQRRALVLLSYIALHFPDSEEFTHAQVLPVLEWASKQALLVQHENDEKLLAEAIGKLELYQSRGLRGFH